LQAIQQRAGATVSDQQQQQQGQQQGGGGSSGGTPAAPYPPAAYMQQFYAQQQLSEELRKFWAQMAREVEEHSEVLPDFKNQALPLARIKKVPCDRMEVAMPCR
jgi:hypothetical protein